MVVVVVYEAGGGGGIGVTAATRWAGKRRHLGGGGAAGALPWEGGTACEQRHCVAGAQTGSSYGQPHSVVGWREKMLR